MDKSNRKRVGVNNFAAIDFETANYSRDSACAIGVAFVRDGCVVDVQRHLIRPPTREFCFTYLHGLTWKDVRKAPTFGQGLERTRSRLDRSEFSGGP